MKIPLTNEIDIIVCEDSAEAVAKGFDWNDDENAVKPIELKHVVVVQNGTERGMPAVDFVLKDETGQHFVFSIPGFLLNMIPC